MEPCGTPQITGIGPDIVFLIFTGCFLLLRYVKNRCCAFHCIFTSLFFLIRYYDLPNRMLYKALLRVDPLDCWCIMQKAILQPSLLMHFPMSDLL